MPDAGPRRSTGPAARVDGYRAALETAGLSVDPSLVVTGDFHHDAGYRLGPERRRPGACRDAGVSGGTGRRMRTG